MVSVSTHQHCRGRHVCTTCIFIASLACIHIAVIGAYAHDRGWPYHHRRVIMGILIASVDLYQHRRDRRASTFHRSACISMVLVYTFITSLAWSACICIIVLDVYPHGLGRVYISITLNSLYQQGRGRLIFLRPWSASSHGRLVGH